MHRQDANAERARNAQELAESGHGSPAPGRPSARLSRAVLAQQQEANASCSGHSPARAGFESEIRALTSDLASSYTKGFC